MVLCVGRVPLVVVWLKPSCRWLAPSSGWPLETVGAWREEGEREARWEERASSETNGYTGALVHVKLQVDTAPERNALQPLELGDATTKSDGDRVQDMAFEMTAEKLEILVHELTQAQKLLESVDN